MRLSMSRQAASAAEAQVAGRPSAAARPMRERQPGPPRRDSPLPVAAVRCTVSPFSKIRVGMRDHNTAPATLAAAPPALIDIGINLAHDSYDRDRDAVIARAHAAGVLQMIVTGATLAGSVRALALAREHPGTLFATAGVPPPPPEPLAPGSLSTLAELVRIPEV